jgi:DNA mismatch endonuclease (patch repair protein)
MTLSQIDPTDDRVTRFAPRRAAGRPVPKNALVSAQMRRTLRSSTKPEVALRRELHARGLRFRLHRRDLPRTPDIVLSRARIAVFVDGCFWHGCPDHGVMPKNNREWWRTKFETNSQRDRRKDTELRELGWFPIHLWEHTTVQDMADLVVAEWRNRTGRVPPSAPTVRLRRPPSGLS